jgi:hypothetical protein
MMFGTCSKLISRDNGDFCNGGVSQMGQLAETHGPTFEVRFPTVRRVIVDRGRGRKSEVPSTPSAAALQF